MKRVLVVEDEGLTAWLVCHKLQKAGYLTGSENNAASALQSIARERPDLVLMDIHIQGPMDGVALAAAIRDEYSIPVVFATAYCDKATRDRAAAAGGAGFLTKPFAPDFTDFVGRAMAAA